MFRTYLTAPGLVWYWQRRTSFFSSEFNEWMEKLQATSELSDPRATAITKSGSEPAAVSQAIAAVAVTIRLARYTCGHHISRAAESQSV